MPLISIVTIVLRIYSLIWALEGLVQLGYIGRLGGLAHVTQFVYWGPVIILFIAIVIFMFSQPIARLVTPPPNAEVNVGALTTFDLYCFAFTVLGLYFVLSSFANTINWLHYFMAVQHVTKEGDPQSQNVFYRLTQPLLTVLAGFASLLFAPRFARKLTNIQRKYDQC